MRKTDKSQASVIWHIVSSLRGSTGWHETLNLDVELREGFWKEATFWLRMKRQGDVGWGRGKQYVRRFVFSDLNAKCPLGVQHGVRTCHGRKAVMVEGVSRRPLGRLLFAIVQGRQDDDGQEMFYITHPFSLDKQGFGYIFSS